MLKLKRSDQGNEVINMSGQDFVYGVFKRSDSALQVVSELHAAGLTKSDIAIVSSKKDELRYLSAELQDPTMKYFMWFGICGCIVGAFAGVMGSTHIPYTTQTFQILVPLMASISGGIVFAYFGCFMCAFLIANKPNHWANVFEGTVEDGELIIAAEPANAEQRNAAVEILNKHNPVELIVRKKALKDIVPKDNFVPTIASERPQIAATKVA